MECVRCVCVWLGAAVVESVDERIGLELYQSCGNRGSVGRVFWLRWCGWYRWGVGRGLGPGSGGVGWCYVCVSCESGLSV